MDFFIKENKEFAKLQKAYADYMSEQMKDKRNYHLLSDVFS